MLTTKLEKVDKFYAGLALILVLMSVLLIFTFRGVFSMFLNASDLNQSSVGSIVTVKIEKLEEAYNFVFKKNIVRLQPMPAVSVEPKKKEE